MNELSVVETGGSITVPDAPQANSLLQAITLAASNPAMDIEKMERLFAMHQAMVNREAEVAFNAAKARVEAKIVPIAANVVNSFTKSKYASLDQIAKMIAPLYTAEGFSISFDTADSPTQGYIRVIGRLSHAAGHSREFHIDLPPDDAGSQGKTNKTAIQAAGSANLYARRYLTCMMFNCVTERDTDGNSPKAVPMPEAVIEDYIAEVNATTSHEQALAVWKRASKICAQMKDNAAHDRIKDAVVAKRLTFAKDVESV